jgi:hypothetical protein
MHFQNTANIILLPKKEGVARIGDYRPISLVHNISKVFSKILGNYWHFYAAPQAHGILNVALHWEYSLGIIFIFSQVRKDLYHV